MSARVGRNAIWGYGREIVEATAFLILTPRIAGALGAEGFGVWSLVWATASLIGLLDLGLSQTVVKFVAAHGDEPGERDTIATTLLWSYGLLGAMAAAVVVVAAGPSPALLGIAPGAASDAAAAFLALGLRSALALPASGLHGILTGVGAQHRSHQLRGAETLVYALGVVAVAATPTPSLGAFAWVSLGAALLTFPLLLIAVRRALPGLSLRPAQVDVERMPELLRFSAHFFVIQTAMLLYGRADAFLVQAFLPVAAVGVWSVASRVSEKAGAFCRQLSSALTPALARAAGDPAHLRELYLAQTLRSVRIATPILLGLALLSGDLVVRWLGAEFETAAAPLAILAAAVWISVLHAPSAGLLSMTGDEAFVSRTFVSAQVVNLVLTVALLPVLGLVGAALSTLVTSLVVDVGLIQRRTARRLDLPLGQLYRTVAGPLVPATAVTAAAWFLIPGLPEVGPGLVGVALSEGFLIGVFAVVTVGPAALTRSLRGRRSPSSRSTTSDVSQAVAPR